MTDELKTDLQLAFDPDRGVFDLSVSADGMRTVSGTENLEQALTLRLLVDKGESGCVGRPRYGTSIRDFIGESLDAANLELIRRLTHQSIMQEPRVAKINRLVVRPRLSEPGSVEVQALVTAVNGEQVVVEVPVRYGL